MGRRVIPTLVEELLVYIFGNTEVIHGKTFGLKLSKHGKAIAESRERCRATLQEWINRVQRSLPSDTTTHDQEHEAIRERFRRLLEKDMETLR